MRRAVRRDEMNSALANLVRKRQTSKWLIASELVCGLCMTALVIWWVTAALRSAEATIRTLWFPLMLAYLGVPSIHQALSSMSKNALLKDILAIDQAVSDER